MGVRELRAAVIAASAAGGIIDVGGEIKMLKACGPLTRPYRVNQSANQPENLIKASRVSARRRHGVVVNRKYHHSPHLSKSFSEWLRRALLTLDKTACRLSAADTLKTLEGGI